MNKKTIILPVISVAITVAVVFFWGRTPAPKPATMAHVEQEAAQGGYELISTQQLWELYQKQKKDILIVDTRQAWEYRTGHIKGAVNFPMEPTWLSRWLKKDELQEFLGPDKERTIVFY